MSIEYALANAAYHDAYWVFTEAQRAYRAFEIGDAEFFAAKAKFNAALAEVEAAFEREAEIADDEPVNTAPTEDNAQLSLI